MSFFLVSRKFPSGFFLIGEGSVLNNIAFKGPLLFKMAVNLKINSAFFPLLQNSVLTEKYLAQMMQEK